MIVTCRILSGDTAALIQDLDRRGIEYVIVSSTDTEQGLVLQLDSSVDLSQYQINAVCSIAD